MGAYRRKNQSFKNRLSALYEELKPTVVTKDEGGRVILSGLEYLKFPTERCAQQFLERVTRANKLRVNKQFQIMNQCRIVR